MSKFLYCPTCNEFYKYNRHKGCPGGLFSTSEKVYQNWVAGGKKPLTVKDVYLTEK